MAGRVHSISVLLGPAPAKTRALFCCKSWRQLFACNANSTDSALTFQINNSLIINQAWEISAQTINFCEIYGHRVVQRKPYHSLPLRVQVTPAASSWLRCAAQTSAPHLKGNPARWVGIVCSHCSRHQRRTPHFLSFLPRLPNTEL